MTETMQAETTPAWTIADISDGGERITHLYPNDCYFAHLSIYYFAAQFVQNKVVLDAGSGAGYGSAYLAEHGARYVYALEISPEAVAFSRHHFSRPNLSYQVMDLQQIRGFEPRSIDAIFSSNVLEHIPDPMQFLHHAWQLLKPDGVLIIAVPPIISADLQADNLANPYHLNIWSPQQWQHALSSFFANIHYYRHGFDKPGIVLDFANAPEQTLVNERDFTIAPVPLEQAAHTPTLTAIFVARRPRPVDDLSYPKQQLTFIDDSFTIPANDPVAGQMSAQLARKLQELQRLKVQLAEQEQRIRMSSHPEQIEQLEATIAVKNAHIAHLETLIKAIEAGWTMRGLRLLHHVLALLRRRIRR
jgi:2-polyprenyl-3-methyl-5-hydroxy-6-metoxy-1,4-benzoquinol methylase